MTHDGEGLIDLAGMMDRFDHDWELLREVMHVFAAETPERMRRFAEASQNGDMEQMVRLAHSLKGVCGTMHAEPLRELSYRVELAARANDIQAVHASLPRLVEMLEALSRYLEAVAAGEMPSP